MNNSSRPEDLEPDLKERINLVKKLFEECYQNSTSPTAIVAEEQLDIANDSDVLWCPRTFDGLSCWPDTPANVTAFQTCPDFVVGFDPKRMAYKRCLENGSWFIHPSTQKPWSNYTTCVDVDDLSFRTVVNNIYIIGYSISVVALLISLIIFVFFRTIRCTRIKIHMHLFTAFLLNNIAWIVWYKTVVTEPTVVQTNNGWCQILHLMTNYFMVTSYIWMFCEGLYLHISLVVVFVREGIAMAWFCALGWGLSFVIVTIYAIVRYFTPGDTVHCWMDQSDSFWIITAPVVVSLLASCVFLFNVVRVLVNKLHPEHMHQKRQTILKATRAALILTPLLGLHFILIPLRPFPNESGEKVYQVASAIIIGLQGFCLSMLFCFTNHEVTSTARAHYYHYFPPATKGIAMTGMHTN